MANIPDKQKALNHIVAALEALHSAELMYDDLTFRELQMDPHKIAGKLGLMNSYVENAYEELTKALEMSWWGSKITPTEKVKVMDGEEIDEDEIA